MDLARSDLELLVMLDDRGSLTAAAAALGVAQPLLSRRLASLERRVRVRLFERGRSGATPTPSGRVACGAARLALDAFAQAERTLAAVARGERAVLRVGVTPTLGADVLGPVLAAHRQRFPDVGLELVTSGDSAALRAEVAHERLDVALAVETPASGVRELWHGVQTFVLAVPSAHEFADSPSSGPLALDLVGECDFVALGSSEGLRGLLESLSPRWGHPPRVVVEPTEREMLLPFVAAGLGCALVPERFARSRAQSGVVLRAMTPRVQRNISLCGSTRARSAAVDAFVDTLRATEPAGEVS